MIGRRELIVLLGGAVALSVPAQAQQLGPVMRRIGVLTAYSERDTEGRSRVAALRAGLQDLGWIEGQNLHVDYRWGDASLDRIRALALELVQSRPDVIVTNGTPPTEAVRRLTDHIPVVFANIADPVATGLISSLAAPQANVTGFANFEHMIGGKWIELLREVAPGLQRVIVLQNPGSEATPGIVRAINEASSRIGISMTTAPARNETDIERAVTPFAQGSNGGMIVLPDQLMAPAATSRPPRPSA
jgi:putative ABC transport system substrate-binding protein